MVKSMKQLIEERKKMNPVGKVIIVEGCELSGKSTLVELLQKHYPSLTIKDTTRPKDDSFEERRKKKATYMSIFNFLHDNPLRTIILDRYFPSELVYSKVKRGYEAFNDLEYRDLQEMLLRMDQEVFIIICKPPIETILDRYKKRGDDYIKEDDVAEIMERYETFYEETKLSVLNVDTRNTKEDLLKEVISFIEHDYKAPVNEPKQKELPLK